MYVIGDSYSTPNCCVAVQDSYWSKFAYHISANTVINHSHIGKNNVNMFRNAVRFVLENKNQKIFVMLGLTSFYRIDYYNEAITNTYNKENGNRAELYVHNYERQRTNEFDKWFVTNWSYEFLLANLLKDILTTSAFLQKYNVDYFIHNCAEAVPAENDNPLVKSFTFEVNKDQKVLNLYKDSFHAINFEKGVKPADYDQYGWHGHHGAEGNENYFHYLKQKFDEIYNGNNYV